MNTFMAKRILEDMSYKLSISNPGIDKANEKTALLMGSVALDKMTGKMPNNHNADTSTFDCPSCGKTIIYLDEKERHKHCLICGQKLQWH